jgi:hypothetical protein
MDGLSTVPADFLGTTFARLGQISPEPSDTFFGLVFRLGGACPSVEDVRARVAARVARLPLLTHRLVARASVTWERDPDFDVAHHVQELPAGTEVLSAQELLASGYDPARPPWRIWISPDGDGWRLFYLVHHARHDAAAALRTVTALLGEGDAPVEITRHAPTGRGWAAAAPLLPDLLATYRKNPPVPRGKYGQGRRLGVGALDTEVLKEIAERTGAAVNQVHLAAMAEALDRWAPWPGLSRRPVNIPVDTRGSEDANNPFVNRLGFMRVGLPCGPASMTERLRQVVTAASRRRTARYRRAWAGLTRAADPRTAAWAMQRITDHTQVSMTLSSLRVPAPLTLADAPVLDVTTIPWLPPAHTCFGFLVSYGDHTRLSVLAPEGAPDPDALAAHWRDAVHELHGAGQSTVARR